MDFDRDLIVALAARHRIPAMYILRDYVAAGGLMSYGTSVTEANRQAGTYVGRILKGARPGDLPIEGPIKFHLAINLGAAQRLGLTIPESLRRQADQLISPTPAEGSPARR